jgi:hypothetical protein
MMLFGRFERKAHGSFGYLRITNDLTLATIYSG